MAVLSNERRASIRSAEMQRSSLTREAYPLNKTQLQAAINACDDWADSNATSFNNALPPAAKNSLTTKQKMLLLAAVLQRRAEVL